MEKEVLISIRGTQTMQGDEPQTVELLTGGVLNAKTLAALSMGAAGLRSLSRCGWGVPGAMTLL